MQSLIYKTSTAIARKRSTVIYDHAYLMPGLLSSALAKVLKPESILVMYVYAYIILVTLMSFSLSQGLRNVVCHAYLYTWWPMEV